MLWCIIVVMSFAAIVCSCLFVVVVVVATQHNPSDTKLQLEWIHNVAEMRLQQAEQDPSPNKLDPVISLLDRFSESIGASSEHHPLA